MLVVVVAELTMWAPLLRLVLVALAEEVMAPEMRMGLILILKPSGLLGKEPR